MKVRQKRVIILEVKLKQNANGVIEERADLPNVDIAAIGEELSEDKFIDINEECSCDERIKMFQRK